MTSSGDVGTEIAPEVADDPQLAARLKTSREEPTLTAEDEDRIRDLAAFTGATLDALRVARRPGWASVTTRHRGA